MKNRPLILIILITLIGVFISFNFELPLVKQYKTLDRIDESINQALIHEEMNLSTLLDTFYDTVSSIINETTMSENQDQISFDQYENEFALLSRMNQNLSNTLTPLFEKLPETDLGQLESERLKQLDELNNKIGSLLTQLATFEEIIHTAKPSQAKAYVTELQQTFNQIQSLQHSYAESYTTYLEGKRELYQNLK